MILVIVMALPYAYAQSFAPTFQTHNTDNGLSHVSIADIAEDKYGFLWFASQSGVDKFDGYTFRNFGMWHDDLSTGLQTLTALQIEASSDGQYLWIGTFSGLSRIDVDTEKFKHYALPATTPFNKSLINRIKLTDDDQLWIISERHLYRYVKQTDSIELVTYLPSSTSTITDVEVIKGTLYVASTAGLYTLDAENHSLQLLGFNDINFTRLVATTQGLKKHLLWLGTVTHGACLFDPSAPPQQLDSVCTPSSQGLSDNYINDILLQRNGDVWIATERGINVLRGHTNKQVSHIMINHKHHSDERISSLYETNAGLIVVGTKDDGLALSNPLQSHFYSSEVGEGRFTASLEPYKDNLVWVANEKGLWLYNPQDKSYSRQSELIKTAANNDTKSDNVLSLHYDNIQDALWVTTRAGLAKLNKTTQELEIVALHGKSGYSLDIDSSGDIWYGGYSDGVFVYRPSQNTVVAQWPLSLTTRVLTENGDYAWLSTVAGLYLANKTTGELTSIAEYTDKLSQKTVVTWISRSERGGYWVGTQASGLYFLTLDKYDASSIKVTQIKSESRLSDISIGAIVEDSVLGLWISTIEGIAYLSPDFKNLSYFGTENGAIANGYYIGSVAVTGDNTVMFGGAGGITQFDPQQVGNVTWAPQVHFTDIEVVHKDENDGTTSQQKQNLGSEIVLTPNDIALSIAFSATDFMNANELRYAYKLADFENSWRYTDHKNRVATYTNLAPGHYRFTVRAINNKNEWSSAQAQLEVTVVPPWYDKPLWRILFVWLAILVVSTIIWLRFATLKRRSEALALKVEEKTRDLEAVVEKLTLLSTQDPLTGLKNRRYFTERAKAAWQGYKRHGYPFALLIIDIDFFKQINDNYGHQVGDIVLTKIGKALEANLRESDVIARWGGEEFLILLPTLNLREAYYVAEKLRKTVADLVIDVPPYSVQTTITSGVADIRDYDSVEACIHAVDKKLYQGKESGRNTVIT
ncbi:hypothetical protein D210916BOD24_17060 [Alteromonas sp. D210916BOD_24]